MRKNFGYSWISRTVKFAFKFIYNAVALIVFGAVGAIMVVGFVALLALAIRGGWHWYMPGTYFGLLVYCILCALLMAKFEPLFWKSWRGLIDAAEKLEDRVEYALRCKRRTRSGDAL